MKKHTITLELTEQQANRLTTALDAYAERDRSQLSDEVAEIVQKAVRKQFWKPEPLNSFSELLDAAERAFPSNHRA